MVENVQNVAFFCDEAGKDTDRYLAVGGLIVPSPDSSRKVTTAFNKLVADHSISGEVKWNRAKKGNYEKYRKVVDLAFRWLNKGT